MNSEKLTKGQQGLRSLPNAAKSLVAKGILKIETIDFYGTPMDAYKIA